MIKIVYVPESDNEFARELRYILCRVSTKKDYNPLTETNFNEVLEGLCQEAFDAGREYQRNQRKQT